LNSGRVDIIDYGLGNIRSVFNAFEAVGAKPKVVEHPEEISSSERLVLPGVGAFPKAMEHLQAGRWIDTLDQVVREQEAPFLGICLGFQLLATKGHEIRDCNGLGWIPGQVTRLKSSDPNVRIPHVGWNDVQLLKNDDLYRGMGDSAIFYFVHSFKLVPDSEDDRTGICLHGEEFAVSVAKNNIFGVQFHPEKSQKAGLQLLENFMSL
jgi:glutamine amidotransferase